MRIELDNNGQLVNYDGNVELLSSPENTIKQLFSQGVYSCQILNKASPVYDLKITNNINNISDNLSLFYGNIRNESRNKKEKKIQLNSKDPRESSNPAIILGIYCFNKSDELQDLICAAWFVDESVNYSSNPSIRGINIDLLQEAKINGFVRNDYKNNVVCCFRPEFIFYYLKNRFTFHKSSTSHEIIYPDEIRAKTIYSYLKNNISHREIEKNILDVENNGYTAMSLLHEYDIDSNKKNILNLNEFSKEYMSSQGVYKDSLKLLLEFYPNEFKINMASFEAKDFYSKIKMANLNFDPEFINRFISALVAKPFLILTGLSGSGKTKLAEAFASWITETKKQICMVAVGSDWTNREPLLGFPNALDNKSYVKPDSGALDLIINAINNPNLPYFLILDEMNMSYVERYFADFLSAMESTNSLISLHSNTEIQDVPSEINLPKNLFIIGTVNIDETTYMFSPKVLDRAHVIEFRVNTIEMKNYLDSSNYLNMKVFESDGSFMAQSFLSKSNEEVENLDGLNSILLKFFEQLQLVGAEFGYRSASEINRFVSIYNDLDKKNDLDIAVDAAIVQKLLPKLHGSRNKLEKTIKTLAFLCLINSQESELIFSGNVDASNLKYPLTYKKLERMYFRLISDGFTSFAEA